MSHQIDSLMFWLEQEPAINSEDPTAFLPADTPTDSLLNRYHYQLGKTVQQRKRRTLERLKAYEMEKIAVRRRTPHHVRDARPRPLVKLEVIKGEDFLNTHRNEFMELFQMTERYQRGDRITNTATYPDSELHLEEWDQGQARALQLKNAAVIEENEKEFYKLRSEIYKEGGHQPQTASSSTAPAWSTNSPPHAPKMSSRDPRSFMADPRRQPQ